MANSGDPDETTCYEPSHLKLHCLHMYCFRSTWLKGLISRPERTIFDLPVILAHTPTSAQSSNLVVFVLQSVLLLTSYKSVCCGYSFELLGQVKVIQMSTNNIWFNKENQKEKKKQHCMRIINYSLMKSSADLTLKCTFIRWVFYYFSSNFEKPKHTVVIRLTAITSLNNHTILSEYSQFALKILESVA